MDDELAEIILNAAMDLRNEIVKKINSNIPPPNKPSTIKQKGSSKTLVDTGNMINSVDMQLIKSGADDIEVAVGIFDPGVAIYALANEYGTDTIPSRSFMRSAYDENIDRILDQMASEVSYIISKKFSH
ncbi:MAG TPA: hypothetical protein PK659_09005 [Methanothrix sp.]|nr:hypothetical protein [Methanothrix sp.]HOL44375.1 hypothetical protein [Methanothrix sp.]